MEIQNKNCYKYCMVLWAKMMQLTRKLTNKIQASYTLEGTVLENVALVSASGPVSRRKNLGLEW